MNLNKVMLIGNLTRDPEVRTIPSGQQVCSFGLATNRTWSDQQGNKQSQPEYHNIVAWGKLADICAQYLHKGKKIYAEGRLQTTEWEGKDGSKQRKTEIVMENMQMLDAPRTTGPGVSTSPAPHTSSPEPEQEHTPEIRIEDIPF